MIVDAVGAAAGDRRPRAGQAQTVTFRPEAAAGPGADDGRIPAPVGLGAFGRLDGGGAGQGPGRGLARRAGQAAPRARGSRSKAVRKGRAWLSPPSRTDAISSAAAGSPPRPRRWGGERGGLVRDRRGRPWADSSSAAGGVCEVDLGGDLSSPVATSRSQRVDLRVRAAAVGPADGRLPDPRAERACRRCRTAALDPGSRAPTAIATLHLDGAPATHGRRSRRGSPPRSR